MDIGPTGTGDSLQPADALFMCRGFPSVHSYQEEVK